MRSIQGTCLNQINNNQYHFLNNTIQQNVCICAFVVRCAPVEVLSLVKVANIYIMFCLGAVFMEMQEISTSTSQYEYEPINFVIFHVSSFNSSILGSQNVISKAKCDALSNGGLLLSL